MTDLSFLRVLDATGSVAGQFCGRLFADHGADVALLEPPGGTPLRQDDALFWHLGCGKRSLVLPPDEQSLGRLLDRADVLLVDHGSALAGRVASRRALVVCTISDFGEDGPLASWRGSELIHQAYAGLAYSTGRAGEEPLYGFGHRAAYSAGIAAYATTVAALLERERSGLGQATAVSIAETAVAMSQNLVTLYSYNGSFARRGVYEGPLGVYECADGWVALFVTTGRWPAVCEAVGLPDLAEDERFTNGKALAQHWPVATERIAAAVRERSAQAVVDAAQARRVPASLVMTLEDVRACPSLAERGYWVDVPAGDGHRPRLGGIARLRGFPEVPAVAAPAVGADTDDVLRDWTERPREAVSPRPREAPLHGVRVLELTTAWAGPMAGRVLASLGADVVKVESRVNPDAWRGGMQGDARRYPDFEPGERPYNRSGWFNTQNHDKRSVELDLKSAEGQTAIRRLVAESDVVICNLAPGALGRLGLDYAALVELRADIVLLEISSFGAGGPFATHVGVGPTVEATTGAMRLIGYPDGRPQNTGTAYIDPIGGLTGAGMVLTALLARARTGAGTHIDVSLREASLQWLGECLVAPEAVVPRGNGAADAAPHVIVPARGEDEWLAVAVFTADEWRALADVLGAPAWADDPGLATVAGRRARVAEIDARIRAWARDRDKHAAAATLQARGVPAAPLNNGRDLHDDAHLAATGFVFELDHPEAGRHRYQGLPCRLAATPARIVRPAPLLGADTDAVLAQAATEVAAP